MRLAATAVALALTVAGGVRAEGWDRADLEGFLAGDYRLLGKAPDSTRTYLGSVSLRPAKTGLAVVRRIEGTQVTGRAGLEWSAEGTPLLRIRFREGGEEREATCLFQSDLDNYPRITCHLYRPEAGTADPGLEVLFATGAVEPG